ncbi:hypothetical protein GPECTOR_2g1453 [Gonium pectorale]|uniref:F-box domain-containing protein n=1 Tax=Gonium pectorale TaxID=33097 RepID=A0A150H1Q4_GONPE|nr:hypothetical protein GPECTOR_2g1453 [Gonium pectorale]|eukprot:KXZ55902.1 hypothetical protein GPECTOR_2g1453 [Gonium pectorale]
MQAEIPPAGSAAIEPECGWGSLSGDVLAALGSWLPLRDRLAAALTCKHWRTQMTRGLLTGLERLSLRGRFRSGRYEPGWGYCREPAGLFGLSSLERLTSLELLLAAPPGGEDWGVKPTDAYRNTMRWSHRDGELAALTRLRRLVADAELLSPPLLAALPGNSLTQLVMERLPLYNYTRHDDDTNAHYDIELLAGALTHLTAAPAASAVAVAAAAARAAEADPLTGPVEVHLDFMGGTYGRDPRFVAQLALRDDLLEALSGVEGLTKLDLQFCHGGAGNLKRLSQLTALTALGLRCSPACHVSLDPWDMGAIAGSCRALTSLALHLPAECLTPAALAALELAPALRQLELVAHTHVRQVPYSRWDVRGRLLRIVQRERVCCAAAGEDEDEDEGGDGEEGSGEPSRTWAHAAGSAAAATAASELVGSLLQPLLFLQELFVALSEVDEVRHALKSEAEWRARQSAAAGGGAAAALPALPPWVLLPSDVPPEDEPDHAAAAAAAFFAAATARGRRAAPRALPQPPPISLDAFDRDQLLRLRSLLLREDLVTGPAFLLDQWAPGALERLSLRGFKGLAFGAGNGGGGGRCVVTGVPLRPRCRRLPQLREIEVAAESEEAAVALQSAIEAWVAEDPERAPQLEKVDVIL